MSASTIQIGRYTGVPVAEGGFATVYRAIDPDLGIPVALKWAHADADEATIASLHHEFRLLREFDCSRLPRAFGLEWADHRPCLVTDWIEGPELWSHPLSGSPDFFAATLRQIARALTFVHHRGWVHGDLKPGNFRWGPPRRPGCGMEHPEEPATVLYLLDFGLARRTGDTERPRGAGTVGYYAPEFLQRLPADGRADWYSVGAMLYEWLFGQRPFAAENPAEEIAGHLEQTPETNIPCVHPSPDWAKEVTERLLLKTPGQRAEDVYDLLRWLGQFDSGLLPEVILNEQAAEHQRSEWRRQDDYDAPFIEEIARSAARHERTRWVVRADTSDSDRLTRGLVNAVLVLKPGNGFTCGDLSTLRRMSEAGAGNARQIRISSDGSDGGEGSSVVSFVSTAETDGPDADGSDFEHVVTLSLLPWDVARVADRLMSLTHDEAFAQGHARPIWMATGGLPNVVANLVARVISMGQLRRLANGWNLDETAIAAWQASSEACMSYNQYLGSMTADERRLCDWLAVGRSQVERSLLRELSALSQERFDLALASLIGRSVVLPEDTTSAESGSLVQFRPGGLSDVWRAQLPEPRRQSCAAGLAAKMEVSFDPADRRAQEVLAECYGDAQRWEKCAEHAVEAASANARIEDHAGARRYIELAHSAAQQIADPGLRAHWLGRALMARGDYDKSVGRIDEARRSYREILALGRRHRDYELLAETLKDLGDLYRMTRQFEKGVRVLRRARQMWETIGNRNEVARTLNNLGNMFWVASDRTQARRYYEDAVCVARVIHADEVVALVLSNLGVTYKAEYDFGRAESHYRESLAIKERLNLPVETARTLNNLGVIALDQGHLEDAADYFKRALELNSRAGAQAEAIFNRGNLIHVALESGDLRTVIGEGRQATADADLLGDVATAAELRGLLAEAFLRAGDFRLADEYLEEAHRQAAGQRNADLDAHLGLVAATRCWRLGLASDAEDILREVGPSIDKAELPRLRIDSMVLRMRMAVVSDDAGTVERLWQEGQAYALSIHAPHKAAQLAFARLPDEPSEGYSREALRIVEEFLRISPGWHWIGAFQVWNAQRLEAERDYEAAEQAVARAIRITRSQGNWETLWQALAVYGRICYRRADYQPALAAFDEANRIIREIGATVSHDEHRRFYLSQLRAEDLNEARSRILELIS